MGNLKVDKKNVNDTKESEKKSEIEDLTNNTVSELEDKLKKIFIDNELTGGSIEKNVDVIENNTKNSKKLVSKKPKKTSKKGGSKKTSKKEGSKKTSKKGGSKKTSKKGGVYKKTSKKGSKSGSSKLPKAIKKSSKKSKRAAPAHAALMTEVIKMIAKKNDINYRDAIKELKPTVSKAIGESWDKVKEKGTMTWI